MDRLLQTFTMKELYVHYKAEREVWTKVAERIVDFAKFHKAKKIRLGARCPTWFSSCFREFGYKCENNLVDLLK